MELIFNKGLVTLFCKFVANATKKHACVTMATYKKIEIKK